MRYIETLRAAIGDLEPYPGNARTHDDAALDESAEVNGQYRSVVARRLSSGLQLLAGHGTVEAFARRGDTDIRVEVIEADDTEAWRIVLADNATSRNAGYDDELLVALLAQAPADGGLSGTGWDDDAYADLLDELDAASREGLTDPDDAPAKPQDPLSRDGDVWLLGEHRLVCGSATDAADLDAALGGAPCHMVWTDPPYGVSYVGGTADKLTIQNDDLKEPELRELLNGAFVQMHRVLEPGRAYYICSPSGVLESVFREELRAAGLLLRQQIVWVKDRFVLGRADYHGQHESILYGWDTDGEPGAVPLDGEPAEYEDGHATLLYGWQKGRRHLWRGGRKQSTVWEFDRPTASKLHPTMKPVGLVSRGIKNGTRPGEHVLDLFGGAGSALIAAYRTGRVAHLVELDPAYCDVIARRFQEHTGIVPVRERTGQPVDFTVDAEAA